ncbi:alpha,alpha-trehalase [Microdochium nivale]|nr:alpha,alpha-trehalase [Microdochium nivale]
MGFFARAAATAASVLSVVQVASALYTNGSVTAPCDSPIYCYGDLLREVELAQPFADSKTFVDLPTKRPLDEVLAAFANLAKPLSNNTELNDFLSEYFGQAGSELAPVSTDGLKTDPTFLDKLEDASIREFVEKVIDIWPELTRTYVGAGNCTGCVNSFIPLNRTFVVAGGRFREPYYWDSFWILEGLLRTGGSFTEISKNIIENFLDIIDLYGFMPNGARIYYLNRSQPPLLTQMVKVYVDYTNDTSILERALPLLLKEHSFFVNNRTTEITKGNQTYTLSRYDVTNTQPRPESFREDYITANNKSFYAESGIIYPESVALNDSQKATLYANLASGAESGWDYSSRWIANPSDAQDDVYFPLRSLNTREIIPVDLNSILYANEITLAKYFQDAGNDTIAQELRDTAGNRSVAMYELMWNSTFNSFFDYNLTSSSQYQFVPVDEDATDLQKEGAPEGYQVLFHVAQFYPFWTGAAPEYLKNNPLAINLAFKRVKALLDTKAGALPATAYTTGQQWDQPNVWPPLMYILMKALRQTPAPFGESDPAYIENQDLAISLAQRYLDSTFCTWLATGGSTSDIPKVEGLPDNENGIMFEKYADNATNVAGGGGEYEVVEGFGWTNGVLIWAVDTFGNQLTRPDCGEIVAAPPSGGRREKRAVQLTPSDARFIKKFARSQR